MKRTKLRNRDLPDYTRGEEIFNMVSHIVGAAFGVAACALCVVKAFLYSDAYGVVAAFLYGFSMIVLYTMSSLYHGLREGTAKRVFQILDHCTIFVLIAGTYTPVALCALRQQLPALGWTVFGIVWGLSILGIVLNAIDLKRYSKLSMTLYLLLGWCIILTGKQAVAAMGIPCLIFMLLGGIAYSVGAIFYAVGGKKGGLRYMHSVFHLFVVLGSLLQFFGVFFYII
ncbi:MAG: hemolysin III family protein [Oscillospiraceae bacterium]|nr:hemolysin III family protein [Oscillospiraceae bacterium]